MFVKIPSIKENVSVVESFIENVGEKIRIEEAIYGNVLVSVTEAVNNAIVHGNKEDKNKKVRLGLKQNKKSVRFIVEDEGMGFDHNTLPDPTNPKNLEKVKGRGIFLIKNLSDKTTFKQGGRVVEMLFKL
ncbi:MAG: ATP-binding protein [Cytophagales bacterium]|tara:strand:- start:182 stop:571 length:390 start_codon:yes stop_codon:yes gene_type:complete